VQKALNSDAKIDNRYLARFPESAKAWFLAQVTVRASVCLCEGTKMHRLRTFIRLMLAFTAVVVPSASYSGVFLSITVAPPVLPVYAQPVIPGPGYIWCPGYWAYGDDDYYWVPGTWVLPPAVGLLWTPGYWGWRDGVYVWSAGYWGPRIGFYGGINYGYGYVGVGYAGGYWSNGVFRYNTAVNNISNTTVTNTYTKTVVNNTTVTNNTTVSKNVSFNGGAGGTTAQPTAQELAAAKDPHTAPTQEQTKHAQIASTNKSLLASVNHGNPAVVATTHAGVFTGNGVVGAKGATTHTAALKNATPNSGPPKNANSNTAALKTTTPNTAGQKSATSIKYAAALKTNPNNSPPYGKKVYNKAALAGGNPPHPGGQGGPLGGQKKGPLPKPQVHPHGPGGQGKPQ
jgi:hypothetical protein